MSACPFVCMHAYLPACQTSQHDLSVCLCVCVSASVCLSVCLSCLPVCQCVCLSVRLSFRLPSCLLISFIETQTLRYISNTKYKQSTEYSFSLMQTTLVVSIVYVLIFFSREDTCQLVEDDCLSLCLCVCLSVCLSVCHIFS